MTACTASSHGTYAAYRKRGCTCPEAEQAANDARRRHNTNRSHTRQITRIPAHLQVAEMPPFTFHPDRACRDADPDLFFPDASHPNRFASAKPAQDICAACPLQQPCADWALRTNQLHGIWGGTTPRQRAAALRQRLKNGAPA